MRWTEESLIEALVKLGEELGKPPSSADCAKCSYTANVSTYKSRFGSWNKAKVKAGFKPLNSEPLTDEELLKSLTVFTEMHGRPPKQKDCRNKFGLCGPNTYKDRFGGWEQALSKAGLSPSKLKSNQDTDVELLESIRRFFREEGRPPKHEDCDSIKKFSYLRSHSIFTRRFGSFLKAVEMAGLKHNYYDTRLEDEELLQTIKSFYLKHGRAPVQEDCLNNPNLRSHSTYHNRFKGFIKAIELAGVPLNPKKSSVAEKEVYSYIIDNYAGPVVPNANTLGGKEIDILIPDLGIGIEYNGLYWHSESRGKDKNYHLSKTEAAASIDIRLIHIFENEWLDKKEIVKSRLSNVLGLSNTIYARKCVIKELDSSTSRVFLNKSHIQGNANASVRLGLYYRDELVAVMTFCKTRFGGGAEWELLRYCNKLHTSVVGGASRLFKKFTSKHKPTSIVTYSDIRWNMGGLYPTLGFEYSHQSKPNYWYFKCTKLESRLKYQKHKLVNILDTFNPSLTEYENMLNNGYNRIFDCGNKVYKWVPKEK